MDGVVFALVGVVAGGAPRTKLAPVNRAIARGMLSVDGRQQRRIPSAVSRVEEERRAEALGIRRDEAAMQRSRVTVVRPHLHDVADVHDERVAARLDELPRAVVKDLEARLVVLQQQRQSAGIRMRVDTEVTRVV